MKISQPLNITMPTDVEIAVTRDFDAPRHLVFQAWTDPELVPRWMLGPEGWTMPVCEIDLRVGGRWRFVWRKADGREMEMTGVYMEIDPPKRLVNTERWAGDWPETVNTVSLTEQSGRTTSVLTMRYPSKAARDAAMASGMSTGLVPTFDRLEAVLASLVAKYATVTGRR